MEMFTTFVDSKHEGYIESEINRLIEFHEIDESNIINIQICPMTFEVPKYERTETVFRTDIYIYVRKPHEEDV